MNFLCCKEARGPNYHLQYFFQRKKKFSEHLPCDAPQPAATRTQLSYPHRPAANPCGVAHNSPGQEEPAAWPAGPQMEVGVLPLGPAALPLPPQAHLKPGPPHAAYQQHSPLRHRASRGSFPWVSSWRRSTTQMGISTWKNSNGCYPMVPTASCHYRMQPCKAAENLYLVGMASSGLSLHHSSPASHFKGGLRSPPL